MPRKTEEDLGPTSFKAFWDAYGLKRDRIGAESAWKRLSVKDRKAALAGIASYRADCQKHGVSMMYAVRYINHRRWEDEIEDSGFGKSMEIW